MTFLSLLLVGLKRFHGVSNLLLRLALDNVAFTCVDVIPIFVFGQLQFHFLSDLLGINHNPLVTFPIWVRTTLGFRILLFHILRFSGGRFDIRFSWIFSAVINFFDRGGLFVTLYKK